MKLEHYLELLDEYVGAHIGPEEFEKRYLSAFKSDQETHAPKSFGILDELFAFVDAFCPDPDLRLRVKGAVDERQLLDAARRARDALRNASSSASQALP